jgi:hypothetical protein
MTGRITFSMRGMGSWNMWSNAGVRIMQRA